MDGSWDERNEWRAIESYACEINESDFVFVFSMKKKHVANSQRTL